MSSPGARGGWSNVIVTRSLMSDPREKFTLREQLALGVGKAQRGIVYSHNEYRNLEPHNHPLQHARVRMEA